MKNIKKAIKWIDWEMVVVISLLSIIGLSALMVAAAVIIKFCII